MKFFTAFCCALPVLALACSSDDSDAPASSAGTSGAGGGATASAGATGSAGGAGGGAGTNASAGNGGSNVPGGNVAGNSENGSGAVPLDEPGDESISGGTADAGTEPPAPVADAGSGSSDDGDTLDDGTMTFFVTSTGKGDGGNLGGLAGADAFCEQLAVAQSADFGRRTWRAYLSTSTVNAIDRIGDGPWRNADGVIVANSSAQLHDPANAAPGGPLDATWRINDFSIPLDEAGAQVPQNVHDILTGTLLDGTVAANETCEDWTSNVADQANLVRIGHSNRTGLAGQRQLWQDVHTVGCSQNGMPNVTQGGGRGSLYCFAVITGE
jgi:hypothetical protein